MMFGIFDQLKKRGFGTLCLIALSFAMIGIGGLPCEAAGKRAQAASRRVVRAPSRKVINKPLHRSTRKPARRAAKAAATKRLRKSRRMATAEVGAEGELTSFPPVLMYHDVKTIHLKAFDVSVADLAQQLDWLQANGYRTLSMEEFVFYMRKGQGQAQTQGSPFPKKSILLTFDDGYQGIYKYAAPELRKRNMKATFFVITDLLGNKDLPGYPYITEEELRELAADARFSIGSHTRTHPHLNKIGAGQRDEELAQSREMLEAMTGRQIHALAYPYGDYNHAVIESARAAGYDLAFAIQDRGLTAQPARYGIPRIYVGLEASEDGQRLFKELVSAHEGFPATRGIRSSFARD